MVENNNQLPIRHPEFAERLQACMEEKGITIADVKRGLEKRGLEITYEMARRYCKGQAMPRPEKLSKLAELVGRTPEYLMFGAEGLPAESSSPTNHETLNNPLDEERLADAKRLRDAFEARKRDDPSLTHEKLAQLCGWKTSTVGKYLLGKTPLNLEALLQLAKALNCSPEELSPQLAQFLKTHAPAQLSNQNTSELQHFTDLRGDEALLVTLYRDLGTEKAKTDFLNLLMRKVEVMQIATTQQKPKKSM